MLIAAYIGNHKKDTWQARLGWWFTRLVQRGEFKRVTHVEAIHAVYGGGEFEIASSSVRDGGVRSKRVALTRENWRIFDMPTWDVARSIELLERTHETDYDWRGAAASALPFFMQDPDNWYCNEWVAQPWLKDAGTFGPAHFISIITSFGALEVTEQLLA